MKLKTKKQQQGIATVLIVLLVGVALTASTLGVIYSVKSTQNKQVTSHATSNAQSAAWALAEAVRAYLELDTTDLGQLRTNIDDAGAAGFPLLPTLGPALAHLNQSTITFNSYNFVDGNIQFDLSINAIDTVSKAASQLNLVFVVQPSSAPSTCEDPNNSIFTGLTHGQDLTINFDGEHNTLLVDGSYGNPTKAAAINGLKRIEATGDIYLKGTGDGRSVDLVKGNGDVYIEQSNNIFANVESGGDLETASNAIIQNAIAAGNVKWGADAPEVNSIQAGVPIQGNGFTDKEGSFDITQFTSIDTVLSRGNMTLNELSTIKNAYSHADINIGKDGRTFQTVMSEGEINCTGDNINLGIGSAGGNINGCGFTTGTPTFPPYKTYVPIELQPSLIADADNYPANYSFIYDDDTAEMHVKVSQVFGIPDGTYLLYDDLTSTPKITNGLKHLDGTELEGAFSLCNPNGDTKRCIDFKPNVRILTDEDSNRPKDSSGNIIQPKPIVEGVINDVGLIKVAAKNGIWLITSDANQIPPGIMYFDRDLRLNPANGATPINGFLAAGDIQIEDSAATLFALNGIPAEVLCGNQGLTINIATPGAPTADGEGQEEATPAGNNGPVVTMGADAGGSVFPEQYGGYPYPENFCNADLTKYRAPVSEGAPEGTLGALPYIGQFAIMAGQKNDPPIPDDPEAPIPPSTYQGGDFYVQKSSTIYGRVIAGNSVQLILGANIDIYGSIGSEAQADGKSNTTNNLNGTINLHTNYLENLEAQGPNAGGCTPTPGGSRSTTLLWSRYQ